MQGEAGRYLVKSRTENGDHMVDLTAYNYAGECTCKDWEVRVGFYLKSGAEPQKPCCRHIEQARWKCIGDHMEMDKISKNLIKIILDERII